MDGPEKTALFDDLRTAQNPRSRRSPRSRTQRQALEPSEEQLHRMVVEYLNWMLKEPACFSTFPSGGYLLGKAAAGRLKARGLKAGMPDILVFFGGRAIGIELKSFKGRVSTSQKEMIPKLKAAGVPVYICRNIEGVIFSLRNEGVPLRGSQSDSQTKGSSAAQSP